MSNKVTYKNYNMKQLEIPMDITEWIEENHISRLVNMIVEGIEEKTIEASYKGGGRSTYHPKMMLKIIIYAYINKTTRGRKIEKASSKEVEKIVETLEEIQEQQEQENTSKERKRAVKKITKKLKEDYLPRLQKYEENLEILGERNSFSKTDTDATFMRIKDDHMKNGQLKAGYNVQVGTNNQFVLGVTVHQNPTDVRTLSKHIEHIEAQGIITPKTIVADTGYGSEENYIYCEENNYLALIPYNMMRQEQKRKYKKDIKNSSNWKYDVISDSFSCPNNRYVYFEKYVTRTDKYGYTRDFKQYKCEDCSDCPLKELCTKAKGNRTILYNPTYEELKAKQRYRLLENEEMMKVYSKRKTEIETFFGNLKQNMAFTRFTLRGIENVRVEFVLHAISHNLIKLAKLLKNKGLSASEFGKYFCFLQFKMKKIKRSEIFEYSLDFLGSFWDFWVSLFYYKTKSRVL